MTPWLPEVLEPWCTKMNTTEEDAKALAAQWEAPWLASMKEIIELIPTAREDFFRMNEPL